MQRAIIISASRNIGHVSLAAAWCSICTELGYQSVVYVPDNLRNAFGGSSCRLAEGISRGDRYDLAVFVSPSADNLKIIRKLKGNKGVKICYVFHEPLKSIWDFTKSHGLKNKMATLMRLLFQACCIKYTDIIFLPSDKAFGIYSQSFFRPLCGTCHRFPLIFDDESVATGICPDKRYFAYIGAVVRNHGFEEFLTLTETLIGKNLLPEVEVLIATKSSLGAYRQRLDCLSGSGRLKVVEGRVMSNEEINRYYNESFLIWNAYNLTTQSGVLAKAFMFATPVLYLRRNQNEFYRDRYNAVAVDSNTDVGELVQAIRTVYDDRQNYAQRAKQSFDECYNYRHFKEMLSEQLDIAGGSTAGK